METQKCHNCELENGLLSNYLISAGPSNEWLHHPAVEGGRESSSGHEEDPFCIPAEVHSPQH